MKPKTHTGTPAPTSVNRSYFNLLAMAKCQICENTKLLIVTSREIRRSGVVNEDEVQMGESCVVLRDPGFNHHLNVSIFVEGSRF